jgi:hypothetical protein
MESTDPVGQGDVKKAVSPVKSALPASSKPGKSGYACAYLHPIVRQNHQQPSSTPVLTVLQPHTHQTYP